MYTETSQQLQNTIILVTGGSGFIGRALCSRLAAAGAIVFVVSRSPNAKHFVAAGKIFYITSLAQLADHFPDIIINLAGEPIAQRWTAAAKDKILKSRIGTTSQIVDYIHSSPKKPTLLISGSAIGFYGNDNQIEFDENSSPAKEAVSFSHSLCAAWEAEAVKAEQHGVRTVLLRIGAVLEKTAEC